MNFGIYIAKGNIVYKKKGNANKGVPSQDLPFLVLEGERDTATSSSKDRLTDNFSSYLVARFLIGFLSFAFFVAML